MRALRLLPALLAAAAAASPAVAEDAVFTGAAELCMVARADAELGPVSVDLALARAGLGGDGTVGTKDAIEPVLRPILEQCVDAHGLPQGNPRDIGGYLIARATRIEAGRRLADRGIDLAWLDARLVGKTGQSGAEFREISKGIIMQMREPAPAGIGLELADADAQSRTLAVLVHAYVGGALTTTLIGAKLKQ